MWRGFCYDKANSDGVWVYEKLIHLIKELPLWYSRILDVENMIGTFSGKLVKARKEGNGWWRSQDMSSCSSNAFTREIKVLVQECYYNILKSS